MIEKHLDMALIGKNYLSYLLGFELLERDQKILVLDDDRLDYGHLYSDSLPQLEVDFLKVWGSDKNIEPLLRLDKYLTPRHLTFIIGKKLLRLGGSPSHNFCEILRKLPTMIPGGLDIAWPFETLEGQKDFDEAFFAFTKRVSQNAFRFNSVQSFNTGAFLAHCPLDIKKCFEYFESVYQSLDGRTHDCEFSELTFFFMSRGKFQKKLSMDLSRFELFHLFLTLLSPLYELDEESLLLDLAPVLTGRGGLFKRTRVREWLFHRSKPWSVELASFDGIIHPEKISLFGADPSKLSIKLENLGQSFGCIRIVFPYKDETKILWKNDKFLRCDKSMLGTEHPLWEVDFGERSVEFNVFVKNLRGSKLEFHDEVVLRIIKDDMKEVFPGLWESLGGPYMEWGAEVWIEGEGSKKNLDIAFPKSVSVTHGKAPTEEERLKQVYYFGPYKEGPLGLLSSLMEIKDGQQFL